MLHISFQEALDDYTDLGEDPDQADDIISDVMSTCSEDEEGSEATSEEEEEDLRETEEIATKLGMVERRVPKWKRQMAHGLRRIAKGMRSQAKGFKEVSEAVIGTPMEITVSWLKKQLPASVRMPVEEEVLVRRGEKRKRSAVIESEGEEEEKKEEEKKEEEKKEEEKDDEAKDEEAKKDEEEKVEEETEEEKVEVLENEGKPPQVFFIGDTKRYRCAYKNCHFEKGSNETIKAHVRREHLKLDPYTCDYCDSFTSYNRASLRKHVQKRHAK